MDEVRRFLRYVLPGLVFIIELFLFFCISDRRAPVDWLMAHSGAGPLIALFLGTGVLGFILANIYHSLYWTTECFAIDHRCLFRESPPGFRAIELSGDPIGVLTKREAWTMVTQYWYSQVEKRSGKDLLGLSLITDRLVDIGHALGTTTIGAFLSIFTWGFARSYMFEKSWCSIPPKGWIFILFLWAVILLVLIFGHFRALKALERIVNSTLARRVRRMRANLIDICLMR
jgi:hypothetical protein